MTPARHFFFFTIQSEKVAFGAANSHSNKMPRVDVGSRHRCRPSFSAATWGPGGIDLSIVKLLCMKTNMAKTETSPVHRFGSCNYNGCFFFYSIYDCCERVCVLLMYLLWQLECFFCAPTA